MQQGLCDGGPFYTGEHARDRHHRSKERCEDVCSTLIACHVSVHCLVPKRCTKAKHHGNVKICITSKRRKDCVWGLLHDFVANALTLSASQIEVVVLSAERGHANRHIRPMWLRRCSTEHCCHPGTDPCQIIVSTDSTRHSGI